ncbi:MAG: hypothetical protein HONDAALG_01983 [Gammaproteobacteria bacterium]|nr:hypothetical protein [Gammaproteobacteria bacterium]
MTYQWRATLRFGRRQGRRWQVSLATPPFDGREVFATVHGRWSWLQAGPCLPQPDDGHRRRWQVSGRAAAFTGLGHAAA